MSKRALRSLIGCVIFLVIALAKYSSSPQLPSTTPKIEEKQNTYSTSTQSVARDEVPFTTSTHPDAMAGHVVRVLDGDTVEVRLDGKDELIKVRMLGVNTPESVDPRRPVECFGKEASQFTKDLLEGKQVWLKSDLQADDRDKYGRWLRNVIAESNIDVSALLVQQGYAYAYVSFPMDKKRKNQLLRLQSEAKAEKRGLWNPETCDGLK